MLMIAILLTSVFTLYAQAQQWYMITDTGVNIAMENVDYLMRSDDAAEFTVVLKNGNPVTGVGSVSFTQLSSIENEVQSEVAEVQCYPNPVKDRMYITGLPAGSRIDIVSLEGKIIKSEETVGKETELYVADLPKGMYILRTISSTLKFVKY